jgi:hypothetical protein
MSDRSLLEVPQVHFERSYVVKAVKKGLYVRPAACRWANVLGRGSPIWARLRSRSTVMSAKVSCM